MNGEPYCRCPVCGECDAHRNEPKKSKQIKELKAERDALRRDAERYRWLKANARRMDFAGLSWTQGCELDARIDAAIDQARKG